MNRAERRQGSSVARADRRTILIWLAIGIPILAIVIGVAIASRRPVPKTASTAPTIAHLVVGAPGADFSAATTGGPFSLSAARGEPVLLEVFATWCAHCQREVAVLNRVFDTYKERIHVVAVSGSQLGLDQTSAESQADVFAFVQQFGARYPVAFDGDLDVAGKYLQGGFPTIVLLDRNGKIAAVQDGEQTFETLRKEIDAVLRR